MSIPSWGWLWTGLVNDLTQKASAGEAYFSVKTPWDYLKLLIIPLFLALVVWWFISWRRREVRQARDRKAQFNREMVEKRAEMDRELAEKRFQIDRETAQEHAQAERELAVDQQQEAALQAYVDQMTELLLEKNLRQAPQDAEVTRIARSKTLMTLRSLDGARKGRLVRFLMEVELITAAHPILNMEKADLSGAELKLVDLAGVDLSGANLSAADLRLGYLEGANLAGADLSKASLSGAGLIRANLSNADLAWADLSRADLVEADLRWANLRNAHLEWANLMGAVLFGVNLAGADLEEADLEAAYLNGTDLRWIVHLTDEQIAKARTLEGTIMPDGKEYAPTLHTQIARWRKETKAAGQGQGEQATQDENSP